MPFPRDKYGQDIIDSSVVDPIVEVTLHIPDWTHSPLLPGFSSSGATTPSLSQQTPSKAAYSGAAQGTTTVPTSARTVTLKTPAVKNNGFNPIWEKDLSLPFDVVGGKEMMDLVFVRFSVWQNGKGNDDDDVPLASYCASLGSLEKGTFHYILFLGLSECSHMANLACLHFFLGFRHLPLHDQQTSQFLFSTLFVKIGIRSL